MTAAYSLKARLRGEAKTKLKQARVSKARKKIMRTFAPLDAARPFPDGLSWYVLAVAPRREFQVAHWLEGRGWFTLVPTKQIIKNHPGRRAGRNMPKIQFIIPEVGGFVFAGVRGAADWLEAELCHHLRGPLNDSGVPLRLPERQIVRFQQEAAVAASKAHTMAVLRQGGKARVLDGPFAGHELDVRRIKGKWATVVQNWFGQEREAQIELDKLEAA